MEENISILDILRTVPKVLDDTNPDAIKVGEYCLPYSVGIEFECPKGDKFNIEEFKAIPNIMSVNVDNSEQRYRIPSGLTGLKCLYDLSETLILNSLLNPESGIHYHIDFTDTYSKLTDANIGKNTNWILEELDAWNYKGTYNTRDVCFRGGHKWIRFQSGFKTMECRIGEMTFDYSLLFKRITHLSDIARRLKNIVEHEYLQANSPILLYADDINKILQTRKIKI